MSGNIKHYFACANSAKGFRNLFSSNLNALDKIYILKGGPGTGKSSLMKKIGNIFLEQGLDAEYIHCSSDPNSLDGVIFREIGVAILDGTAPHVIEPTAPGAIEEYVNLGTAWDINKLTPYKKDILYLQNEISKCYPNAYNKFADALAIHDEWEKIYISEMDFDKANLLTEATTIKLLGNIVLHKDSHVVHRFFGGSTPYGPLDHLGDIISNISKRYFIKGRPGSGKSTMMKKILAVATNRGIDAEVYHCGFDPDSLDMLLFPELDVCIFDSTAPHEYEPSRPTDEIIDMYTELITPLTDENNKEALDDIVKRYKSTTAEGTSCLARAKHLHDELEKYYINATDFSIIDTICNDLVAKIQSYVK